MRQASVPELVTEGVTVAGRVRPERTTQVCVKPVTRFRRCDESHTCSIQTTFTCSAVI